MSLTSPADLPRRLLILIVPLALSACAGRAPERHYGAVIDAGSSGSRLAMYEWRVAADQAPHAWPVASARGDCPLSDALKAKAATCRCLQAVGAQARDEARRFLGEPKLARVPLWLKATAGVRDAERKHPGAAAALLAAAAHCLDRLDGYEWKGAEVISGAQEAAYAWLAVNHLAGTLRAGVQETQGIVEVGGQSAQIAYRLAAVPPGALKSGEEIVPVTLGTTTLSLYTVSYLALGRNAAAAAIHAADAKACTNDGDQRECLQAIDAFLCLLGPADRRDCPDLARSIPPVSGMRFAGLSVLEYAVKNMGLGEDATLADVRDRVEKVCGPDTREFPVRRLVRESVLVPAGRHGGDVCFDAFYATRLVQRGWSIDPAAVQYPALKHGTDASWTLGAMLVEAARQSP